jgi:SET domain
LITILSKLTFSSSPDLFCSQDCRKTFDDKNELITQDPTLYDTEIPAILRFALEMKNSDGSFEKLKELLNDKKLYNVFDFDFSSPDDSKINKLMCILSLNNSKEVFHSAQHYNEFCLTIQELAKGLKLNVDDCEMMTRFVHRMMRIIGMNEIFLTILQSIQNAKGLFPFSSLINHSCDANARFFTVDNKIALIVMKPIRALEQISVSYG